MPLGPGAGLALAALLATRRVDWPWIAAGILAGGATFHLVDGGAPEAVAGLIAAGLAVPLIGAAAVRRVVATPPRPWRVRELRALLVGGALVGPAAGALLGAAGIAAAGDDTFASAWLTLATAAATGVLVTAPLLLSIPLVRGGPPHAEAVACMVLGTAAAVLAFGVTDLPFGWLAVLPMAWAALRAGSFWLACTGALVSVFTLALTARGYGSYTAAVTSEQDAILLAQAYLCVSIVVCATLAALTAELHTSQEEARQAQRIESVGRMAAAVAHDFNHLLAIVGGYGAVALERVARGEDPSADIEKIVDAGERGSALTRQLVTFSTPGAGKRKHVAVNAVVEQMAGLLRSVAPGVELDLDPGAGMVDADPSRLEQVLLNLVLNARDATATGGSVRVRTSTLGGRVALSVADTGIGMDAATRQRAIEPFFTTKAEHGTGLGLSTVYGIVQEADGVLEIESEPGAGTRITVLLPRVAAPAPAPPEPAPSGSGTVLVVEDDAALRMLLRMMLTDHGFTVLEAGDGAEALAVARDHRVDALVSDISLPGMSGAELRRRLSAEQPDVRALFISGYDAATMPADLDGAPLLTKPFSPLELVRRVRAMLDA